MMGRLAIKRTTSELVALDVRDLHRRGAIKPDSYLTVSVKDVAGNQGVENIVHLTWTGLHFGGRRPWFLCPDCSRRVAILYHADRFACRHCHNLTYDCQRETGSDRAQRRASKIGKRLEWTKGRQASRPKWMHQRTFFRLCWMHRQFETLSLALLLQEV